MDKDPLLQPLKEATSNQASGKVTQDLLNATNLSEERKQEQFLTKIEHKSLLLHPTTATDSRTIKRDKEKARLEKKRRPKPLSARERKKSGWDTIPQSSRDPQLYEALNTLWQGYMAEILADGSAGAKLLKADYHGARVTVVQSSCPSHVFATGIVIKETRNTFDIGKGTGRVVTIPKRATVFEFETQIPATSEETGTGNSEVRSTVKWQVFGEHFGYRAAERVSKKFKGRSTIDF
jgi:ribonuclease P protein subunit POP4